MSDTRQHVHELVDRLPPAQLAAVEGLLQTIVPQFEVEDEEISEDEREAVVQSKEWFKHNQGTSLEDVASELGFDIDQIRSNR